MSSLNRINNATVHSGFTSQVISKVLKQLPPTFSNPEKLIISNMMRVSEGISECKAIEFDDGLILPLVDADTVRGFSILMDSECFGPYVIVQQFIRWLKYQPSFISFMRERELELTTSGLRTTVSITKLLKEVNGSAGQVFEHYVRKVISSNLKPHFFGAKSDDLVPTIDKIATRDMATRLTMLAGDYEDKWGYNLVDESTLIDAVLNAEANYVLTLSHSDGTLLGTLYAYMIQGVLHAPIIWVEKVEGYSKFSAYGVLHCMTVQLGITYGGRCDRVDFFDWMAFKEWISNDDSEACQFVGITPINDPTVDKLRDKVDVTLGLNTAASVVAKFPTGITVSQFEPYSTASYPVELMSLTSNNFSPPFSIPGSMYETAKYGKNSPTSDYATFNAPCTMSTTGFDIRDTEGYKGDLRGSETQDKLFAEAFKVPNDFSGDRSEFLLQRIKDSTGYFILAHVDITHGWSSIRGDVKSYRICSIPRGDYLDTVMDAVAKMVNVSGEEDLPKYLSMTVFDDDNTVIKVKTGFNLESTVLILDIINPLHHMDETPVSDINYSLMYDKKCEGYNMIHVDLSKHVPSHMLDGVVTTTVNGTRQHIRLESNLDCTAVFIPSYGCTPCDKLGDRHYVNLFDVGYIIAAKNSINEITPKVMIELLNLETH